MPRKPDDIKNNVMPITKYNACLLLNIITSYERFKIFIDMISGLLLDKKPPCLIITLSSK
jgi:hypothetical protein